MFMAKIYGWYEVVAFSTDADKAKRLALRKKKQYCTDDLKRWTWATVEEYYGASVVEIKDGLVIAE